MTVSNFARIADCHINQFTFTFRILDKKIIIMIKNFLFLLIRLTINKSKLRL